MTVLNKSIFDSPAFERMCASIFHTDGSAQRERFTGLLDAHMDCFKVLCTGRRGRSGAGNSKGSGWRFLPARK